VARRIILSILALIAAVIGVIAVPLGILTSGQDRHAFSDETEAAASTLANAAEERLDDGIISPALGRAVGQLSGDGYRVSVLDAAGRRLAGTPVLPGVSPAELAASNRGPIVFYPADGWIGVAAPVRSDSRQVTVGTVVLNRPTSPVDGSVALLWTLIAAVSAAGLAAAGLVAIGLARWVARPLRDLERAAQVLGDGDLSTRSPASHGPEEVRRLAANFNQMAARLEALVHGNRATMADVSHQLRTPLAALRLRLDVLAQDSDEEMSAELAGAQEEIARLSRLVNGLLEVARAEKVTAAPVFLAVHEVITNRVAAWRPAAEERDVTLVADVQPVSARMADGQLEQVLDNLIANALDALPTGGSIRIGSALVDEKARITVADNGPGPSPLWYATRATGVVALLLLTMTVALGVAGTARYSSPQLPRVVSAGLHRNVSLLALGVIIVHIVTTVLDPFAPIGFASAVIPFSSPYRPLWLSLGTIAFDMLLALILTSLFRPWLPYSVWRGVHWLAYACWPVALWHGLGTGTDSKLSWLLALDAVCVVVVAGAVWWRLRLARPSGGRTVARLATAAFVLATIAFVAIGPLQHGWSKRAGTPTAQASSTVLVRGSASAGQHGGAA
jgi:signal transduction histidine kinase